METEGWGARVGTQGCSPLVRLYRVILVRLVKLDISITPLSILRTTFSFTEIVTISESQLIESFFHKFCTQTAAKEKECVQLKEIPCVSPMVAPMEILASLKLITAKTNQSSLSILANVIRVVR